MRSDIQLEDIFHKKMKATTYNQNPLELKAGELITSAKGQKAAQLHLPDGSTLRLKLGGQDERLVAPFGLSSWDGNGNRVSLDCRMTPEIENV